MKKIVMAMVASAGLLIMTGCAAFDSAVKDFESDTKGLDREVTVLNEQGDVVATYEGVIRIVPTEVGGKVVFELDGKRIGIYNMDVLVVEK